MKLFFDAVRGTYGALSQEQVDGFNTLIKASDDLPVRHQAYVLATAAWETARTMQPIYERGPNGYFEKYEPGTKLGKVLGNTKDGDGFKYRGRGYVQLTGRRNYALAGTKLGINLLDYPDKALEPEIAARIIVRGMSEGWFTGKKMSDYSVYGDMRRVVNGTDKADTIAGYAITFERGLLAAAREAIQPVPPPPVVLPPPPDVEPPPEAPAEPPKAPAGSIAAVVIGGALAIIAAVLKALGVI